MNKKNYDSDFCGNLPLHLINTIQPYGALILLDKEHLKVIQASENIGQLIHIPAHEILNKKLDVFLDSDQYQILLSRITQVSEKDHYVFNLNFNASGSSKNLLCNLHRKAKYFLLELEPRFESISDFTTVFQEIQVGMNLLKDAKSLEELCQLAAKEIKKISGFDKVMIYHFDEDWNGIVLGEEKENDMDSYLGLRFPASDIPRQARELYYKNPYRFIPNKSFEPVKLHPVLNPITFTYSDLSDCNLRGVAPVHLEYLQNMNVFASMSVAIIKDHKLWGLITCHHKTVKVPEYAIRSAFELISNIFSSHLRAIESEDKFLKKEALEKIEDQLFTQVAATKNIAEGLLFSELNILELLNATGAIYYSNNGTKKIGNLPGKEVTDELIHWLTANKIETVFAKDSIGSLLHIRNEEDRPFSGFIVLPINVNKSEYLIAFRKEVLQTLLWGGDPNNAILKSSDDKIYHPRNSFSTWKEMVRNKSEQWSASVLEAAESLRRSIQNLDLSGIRINR